MIRKKDIIFKNWSLTLLIFASIAGIILHVYFHILPEEVVTSFILLLLCLFSINQIITNEQIKEGINDLRITKGIIKQVDVKEFYSLLGQRVEKATKTIDLTIHQSFDPETSNFKERQKYFQKIDNAILKKKIRVRRITTINSIEKLELVKKWLKRYEKCPNFHLRYSPVSDEQVPMPLSIGAIDNKIIFISNIVRGCHVISEDNVDIYIEDAQLADIFQRYYNKYWGQLLPLKEGDWINWDKLNQIEISLKNKM